MDDVENKKEDARALSSEDGAQFCARSLESDWAAWDLQIERHAQAGLLDDLAEKALRDHGAGGTTLL